MTYPNFFGPKWMEFRKQFKELFPEAESQIGRMIASDVRFFINNTLSAYVENDEVEVVASQWLTRLAEIREERNEKD